MRPRPVPCLTPALGGGPAPNIVIIYADDLGYGEPPCYGGRVPMPAMDRLAREGCRFADAHAAAALCSPSRYALLTGRYPWRTPMGGRILADHAPLAIEPSRMTVPSLLREHGYRTAAVGKWHLGFGSDPDQTALPEPLRPGPLETGFDSYFGIPVSHNRPPFIWVEDHQALGRGGVECRRIGGYEIGPQRVDDEVGPILSAQAVATIERLQAEPFFLYLATAAVHIPITPAPAFRGRSGSGPYQDFVMEFDATVAAVLETLDRCGIAERTLVIVSSDNGPTGGGATGPLRGEKKSAYEGGHRLPFLARWPSRIPPGLSSAQTLSHADLLASFAAMLGATLPEGAGEDSCDMHAALLGQQADAGAPSLRPAGLVTVSNQHVLTLRDGPWKLIDAPQPELYDLAADLGETRDLARVQPARVAAMRATLDLYRQHGRSRPGRAACEG